MSVEKKISPKYWNKIMVKKIQESRELTMKASEIQVGQRTLIENDNSDSLQVLYSAWQLQSWINKNGNVDVVYSEELKRYQVPAFADSRKKYSDEKMIDCAKWGSN